MHRISVLITGEQSKRPNQIYALPISVVRSLKDIHHRTLSNTLQNFSPKTSQLEPLFGIKNLERE